MLLYINQWFPARYRARATAVLFISAPMGNAVAGLLSVPLLRLNGLASLHGWQWMFLTEAAPALVLGLYVLFHFKDRPRDAQWLTAEESCWLEDEVRVEIPHDGWRALFMAIWNRRVALMSLIYFGRTAAMYGFSLFLPLILKGMGFSNSQVGYLATGPFLVAALGAVAWAAHSDHRNERHWHTIVAMLLAAGGLAVAAALGGSLWALGAISLAAIGLYAQAVSFWSLPPRVLDSIAVPAGIAAINAVGNLGGFLGPYIVGATVRGEGDFSAGLYLMAMCAAVSAALSVLMWWLAWDAGPKGRHT